ncbi:MAG: hypothetical protein NVS9B15_18450 [Acidobacteriaceae bacterium]
MFTQAQIAVENTVPYEALRNTIAHTFASADDYLHRLTKSGVRVRDWQAALAANLFGIAAKAQYALLNPAEQGLIREFYLSGLEKVDVALRFKYRKLYGYY